jgi:homoserine dehydrogenase
MSGGTNGALRIGIAGLGTVGGGLIQLLGGRTPDPGERPLEIAAVSARNRNRKRDVDISRYRFVDDPCALAADREIDVFVELIGGSDGPAKKAVETALARGAHVVTANKALLAEHGVALAALSEAHGGQLFFEAAVAGGLPIVKVVKESLAANRVRAIAGILNGTCNYLLTEIEASGRAYGEVLADAQRLGYAEADPTMDVGGFDAAHKITLLAAIGFGERPDFARTAIEGVDGVTLLDILMAGKLGYRIKLVAKAERTDAGVRVEVHPALLPLDHPLARVDGSLNAVLVDADPVGRLTFVGAGAGAGPTASAVAADIIDLAHGARRPVFGRPLSALKEAQAPAEAQPESQYYLRLLVHDRPGVIAVVSDRLSRHGVSIESFLQLPDHDTPAVPIVLTTQRCPAVAMERALGEIAGLDALAEAPRLIRIDGAGRGGRAWR